MNKYFHLKFSQPNKRNTLDCFLITFELHQAYTEFENSLSIIGWHFKSFCFYYYQDTMNDSYDDEIESNRFYEKQKKKKQRKTHSFNELLSFISYITKQPDFKKKD